MRSIQEKVLRQENLVFLLLGILAISWMVLNYDGQGSKVKEQVKVYPLTRSVAPPVDRAAEPVVQGEAMRSAIPVAAAKKKAPSPVLPITAPTLLNQVAPVYPAEARSQGISGEVVLSLLISASGDVREVRIAGSSGHPILDRAAQEAAYKWQFSPAMQGSVAAESWYQLPIVFSLTDK